MYMYMYTHTHMYMYVVCTYICMYVYVHVYIHVFHVPLSYQKTHSHRNSTDDTRQKIYI